MSIAPATPVVADSPHTANIARRRKRLRDKRCFAISAASAPPPCKTSYCCGVTDGVCTLMVIHLLQVCVWRFIVVVTGVTFSQSSHQEIYLAGQRKHIDRIV